MFKKKIKQYTWAYCPGCKQDLCSNPGVTYTDTDLVRYKCPCGYVSEWDFDLAPAPIFVRAFYANAKPIGV
jgi:hypothetical protein